MGITLFELSDLFLEVGKTYYRVEEISLRIHLSKRTFGTGFPYKERQEKQL